METPERIWFLLSRNLSGEATPADKDELMTLLQQQPELMQQYDLFQQLWTVNNDENEEKGESEKIRQILQLSAAEEPEENIPVRRIGMRRFMPWAAVFVACALLAALLIWNKTNPGLAVNEIVAPRGSKTRTILPDGSTVWLNAGSRISYTNFNGPVREVILEGEAFFDVAHAISRSTGKKLPFIVHAGNIDIKVLGTAFNVKSYPDDKTIETTLIRGLVQIVRKDGADQKAAPFYLHPNEKVVLPKNAEPVSTQTVTKKPVAQTTRLDSTLKEEERIETAWVYNRLQFRGDNFEALAPKLERWYNIRITFEDEAAKQLVFNGSLENESIEQAFQALKAANDFNVTIRNNEVYINSNSK